MNAVFYPAVFHPEETGYSVTVPDIEGCFTQGDTMDEAVRTVSYTHLDVYKRQVSGSVTP